MDTQNTTKFCFQSKAPLAASGPVTVYVKPYGRKYMATYAFTGRGIRKVITDMQLLELMTDSAYVVKQ